MRRITMGKIFGYLLVSVLLGIVLYLGVQIFAMTSPSYTYETVITYSYTDSITAEGYVLFEETFVEGSGDLGYLVEDGNRVSKGQAVAEYYTSDAQREMRTELEQVNAEIALLEASENTAGTLIDNLVSQRNTAIYALLEQLDQGDYSDTQTSEESFLLAQNKMQITTGQATDFSDRIEALTAQSEALSLSLEGLEELTSPVNGYFVSKNSAQFLPYTMEELTDMSIGDFADTLTSSQTANTDNIAGKVVSSYTWYFVGVCSIEESSRFSVGASLELAFPDKTDTTFPASVVSVEEDEDSGLVRVTLVCEYIGADALSLGQESAEIIFATYEGLRIPADAVRMQEQTTTDGSVEYVNGVYVAYNGVAKFQTIEVLYQTSSYILVPLEGESTLSSVRLYDQVIISGTNLYDGKLL